MIKRICVYGGPGSGKSTLTPQIFSGMKKKHYNVEYVGEWIKGWAVEGRTPEGFDQLYVLAKQVYMEESWLRNGIDYIVCECPLLMNTAYASWHKAPCANKYIEIAQAVEEIYPSLNFFIDRTVPYVDAGRYQNEQQAHEFDEFLREFLNTHLKYEVSNIQVDNLDHIMTQVDCALN